MGIARRIEGGMFAALTATTLAACTSEPNDTSPTPPTIDTKSASQLLEEQGVILTENVLPIPAEEPSHVYANNFPHTATVFEPKYAEVLQPGVPQLMVGAPYHCRDLVTNGSRVRILEVQPPKKYSNDEDYGRTGQMVVTESGETVARVCAGSEFAEFLVEGLDAAAPTESPVPLLAVKKFDGVPTYGKFTYSPGTSRGTMRRMTGKVSRSQRG